MQCCNMQFVHDPSFLLIIKGIVYQKMTSHLLILMINSYSSWWSKFVRLYMRHNMRLFCGETKTVWMNLQYIGSLYQLTPKKDMRTSSFIVRKARWRQERQNRSRWQGKIPLYKDWSKACMDWFVNFMLHFHSF